uniref:Uncharacterized protein n=1 Tax=Arundo donax TaxID=35708 RepID=A0A0A8ZLF0_ARUDO
MLNSSIKLNLRPICVYALGKATMQMYALQHLFATWERYSVSYAAAGKQYHYHPLMKKLYTLAQQ